MRKKILLVFGTRPEAIKMAPLVREFRQYPLLFDLSVCVTGQHRQMLEQVLNTFGIVPDVDLQLMRDGQDLTDLTTRILLAMRDVLRHSQPDLVLVHGDTVTSMAVAMAAFYQSIPVAHVEAGLRTHNVRSPWPEEMNRQLTARLATYHLAPTDTARQNLLRENIAEETVLVTGNTVIDALLDTVKEFDCNRALQTATVAEVQRAGYDLNRLRYGKKMVLITGHRRENFGRGFLNICQAIRQLALDFPAVDFVYPVHLNPNVQGPVQEILSTELLENVFLIEPLAYTAFVCLMKHSHLVLTDSGGIQEEAPGLGKPVLVMRDTTERPEAVEAGTVKLVGADYEGIVTHVRLLLKKNDLYQQMSLAHNPYGDGKAATRIVNFFREKLFEPTRQFEVVV